jgi:hypothetical protein
MYVVECCFSLLMLQEEEEEYGTEYLVQPVGQPEDEDEGASDFEPGEGDDEEEDDDFEDEGDDVVEEGVKEPVEGAKEQVSLKRKWSREDNEEKDKQRLKH